MTFFLNISRFWSLLQIIENIKNKLYIKFTDVVLFRCIELSEFIHSTDVIAILAKFIKDQTLWYKTWWPKYINCVSWLYKWSFGFNFIGRIILHPINNILLFFYQLAAPFLHIRILIFWFILWQLLVYFPIFNIQFNSEYRLH